MSDTNDPQAPYGHCTGCTDPRSEGTHQMGTIEHPLGSEEPGLMATFQPTGRAPLLSDDEFKELLGDDWIAAKGDRAESAGKKIRDFYEAKITSGELMVMKRVNLGTAVVFDDPVTNNHGAIVAYDAHMPCCGHTIVQSEMQSMDRWDFCPGCGAQIVK